MRYGCSVESGSGFHLAATQQHLLCVPSASGWYVQTALASVLTKSAEIECVSNVM